MVECQLQPDLLDLKGLLENLIRKTNADPFVNVFADQIRWLQPAKSLAGYLHNYKKLPLADLQDNIAQLLHAAGDNKEALQYGDQALALRRKFLHSRHPKVATSYNNISLVYHSLGQYEEALKSARQSQKIQEALSKPDIANLAICYNNLAMSYRELGRTEEALTFLKKSLPLMKAHLGETHPNVARCLQNIAHCYNQEGNYREALVRVVLVL